MNHGLEIWHGDQLTNQPYTNGELVVGLDPSSFE
jgi:hypothetical protein